MIINLVRSMAAGGFRFSHRTAEDADGKFQRFILRGRA
jgi:hypothetical protein